MAHCVPDRVDCSWASAPERSKLYLEIRHRWFTKEAVMYIPSQHLQAIHQDAVNDALRRSERRRMLKERETETETRARTWSPGTILAALVRSRLGLVARP